jgi:uncharacterized FlaG/YvyC family protein
MQKFLFLLLLCLFSAFMSDNNENKNMETQLEKLQNQLQKWQTDLISYEAWARQNDGVLDKKEKEEIKKRKEDILDIAKHILKIGKAKNLNFPFADALKTLIIKSAEKKSETLEDNIPKGDFIKLCKQKLSVDSIANSIKAVKDPNAKVNMAAFNKKSSQPEL